MTAQSPYLLSLYCFEIVSVWKASGGKMGGDVAAVTSCHIPVTRRNGYGNVTGNNLVTLTHTRVTRSREPARVLKPVPITNATSAYPENRELQRIVTQSHTAISQAHSSNSNI
jgi:hypothetical protein